MEITSPRTDILLGSEILNVSKTDYGVPQLFFGQEQGLLDTLHKYYPKLWSLFKRLRKMDWDETEFAFEDCNIEFKTCPPHVYDRMINTLAWQWEGDTVASKSIFSIIAPFCSAVEVTVPYCRITDNEHVHALTYSDIVKGSFDNPDEVLGEILGKVEPLRRLVTVGKIFSEAYEVSHLYALKKIELTEEVRDKVYMFLVALYYLERVQFMCSFAVTFDICRKGYFPPIRAAVEKIAMDEYEIHAQFGQEVLRIIMSTEDGMRFYNKHLKTIIRLSDEICASEETWLDWLYRDGDYDGFATKHEMRNYLYFNLNVADTFMGINDKTKSPPVTENPIPWVEDHMNLSNHQASPQEEDENNYMVNLVKPDHKGVVVDDYDHMIRYYDK